LPTGISSDDDLDGDTAKAAGGAVVSCSASLYNTADAPGPGRQPHGNAAIVGGGRSRQPWYTEQRYQI